MILLPGQIRVPNDGRSGARRHARVYVELQLQLINRGEKRQVAGVDLRGVAERFQLFLNAFRLKGQLDLLDRVILGLIDLGEIVANQFGQRLAKDPGLFNPLL